VLFERRLNKCRAMMSLETLFKGLRHAARVLYRLRAQVIVSVLAFTALAGIGEIHHVYRNMVLEIRSGWGSFVLAIVSVTVLSAFIWYTSIIVLLVLIDSSGGRSDSLRTWRRRFPPSAFRDETYLSPTTAAIVAVVSVLPLLGLALGLWLAIPKMPEGGALRFPGQERTPDQPVPQPRSNGFGIENRTQLPSAPTLADRR
jgi:hypothetical protein